MKHRYKFICERCGKEASLLVLSGVCEDCLTDEERGRIRTILKSMMSDGILVKNEIKKGYL